MTKKTLVNVNLRANEEKDNKRKYYHWTDVAAEKIIREKGDKDKYVLASGITPSGVVHIGNFREIITVELVKRALEKRGKKVRFIYSWDDYDVFRKVPKGMPQQEMLKEYLRMPIVDVPDPFGTAENYARHHELEVEKDIKAIGISPEFLYQSQKYRNKEYAEGIKTALQKKGEIIEILNQWRKEKLEDYWYPVTAFCEKCKKDTVKFTNYDGDTKLNYECDCGHKKEADLRKDGEISLKWRIDWPMRWAHEKVDFEPGGKDHSTVGGSYTTSQEIVKLYGWSAPSYQMYDFIRIKGGSGKISSSLGDVITLKDCLDVYEPEIVRYLFAGTRPNREFAISFDVDVLAIYEEFDKVERIYFGLEKVNEKETIKNKVAYELSSVFELPKVIPYQPGFRHLTTLLQIYNFNIDKVIGYFEKELVNDYDKKKLRKRAECVTNWVKKYAPEEFKFSVQNKCQVELNKLEKEVLHKISEKLLEKEWTDVDLHEEMYILFKNNFKPQEFFKMAYNVLINKDQGPKLASFILEIGRERVAKLFKSV